MRNLILTVLFPFIQINDLHCFEFETAGFLKFEDELPCAMINLPKGFSVKRLDCHEERRFQIAKEFFDYPVTKEKYDILNKIRSGIIKDPFNATIIQIAVGELEYGVNVENKKNVKRKDSFAKMGKKISWYSYETDMNTSSYKYYCEAVLEDIYSLTGKQPPKKLNCHVLVKSQRENELSRFKKIINNMSFDDKICDDFVTLYFAGLENLNTDEKIQYTMNNLEKDIFAFKSDYCGWKFSGNEITNEKEKIYSIDQLNIIAFEQIIPIGKEAIPELLTWLSHSELQMRYIAFFSLEKITGKEAPFLFFGKKDEKEWIDKYSKIFSKWYGDKK